MVNASIPGRIRLWRFFACFVLLFGLVSAARATGNIDAGGQYAWSENVGWVNHAPTGGGVFVYDDHLEGHAWAENIGWVRLGSHSGGGAYSYGNSNATDWGVNRSGAALSGFAWSDTAGWINFKPTGGGVTVNAASGVIDGWAWGENIGWIHMRNAAVPYGVQYNPSAGMSIAASAGTPQSAALHTVFAATLTATVTSATGNPMSGVSVTFTAPASGASGTFSNATNTITVSTNASGVASAGNFTANGVVGGPYTVTATAGGVNASYSLTNTAGASGTVVGSSPNPSVQAQSVTFTATVTGVNPSGTVQFKDGAAALGSPVALSGGSASYTTGALTVGSHSITAVYSGDANNAGGVSAPYTQIVNPTGASATLSSSLNPSVYAGSVTFTATVTGNSPSGTIQFKDGGAALGAPVPLSGGSARYTTATLTVGSHAITAVYSGDANNAGATSPVLHQTVTATAVPTLSEWALALLAAVLLFTASRRLRQTARQAAATIVH